MHACSQRAEAGPLCVGGGDGAGGITPHLHVWHGSTSTDTPRCWLAAGYAKEMSKEFIEAEMALFAKQVRRACGAPRTPQAHALQPTKQLPRSTVTCP